MLPTVKKLFELPSIYFWVFSVKDAHAPYVHPGSASFMEVEAYA